MPLPHMVYDERCFIQHYTHHKIMHTVSIFKMGRISFTNDKNKKNASKKTLSKKI